MSTLVLTTILATAVVLLCVIGMSIGKIITGKNKLSCKRCGNPEKDKSGCGLCKKDKKNPPKN